MGKENNLIFLRVVCSVTSECQEAEALLFSRTGDVCDMALVSLKFVGPLREALPTRFL